ncbi:glycoside hydrolase family 32 protein [Peristeroidobacter soli]|uniref:glycoside hydrolase family 32 protein n=1 Tax=Peristeroidobacter soli TaxID=2497877 RepID=UPI00101B5CF7|nr:glycoside hydrolase family 32 protein [Peristeroidobacter soli]
MAAQPEPRSILDLVESARSIRELIQSDPHRPIFHFVAPEGYAFPFDPNGAIYWKGKYHLGFIYQKRPTKDFTFDSGHVWGHAVSTDLLHWTLYPDMLNFTEGDREKGIFSGGAFLSKEGTPHLIYHGFGTGANLLACAADDDLKLWTKLTTPALKEDSPPNESFSVFDPCAWYDRASDYYYQISGGMKPGLFKSRDLREWEYLGNAVSGENRMRYEFEDVACPAFFPVGDKWMLLFISHTLGAQYYVGDFADDRFTPERHGRMTWPGGSFFSIEHLTDARGRNIVWGWITQHNKPAHLPDYGWSGIMSLPRVVSLDDTGVVRIDPPEEIETIRLQETRERDLVLQPDTETTLRTRGRSLELKIEIAGGKSTTPFGIKVFASPDGREQTVIRYEPAQQQVVVDFVKSSVAAPVSVPAFLFGKEVQPGFHPDTDPAHRAFVERVSAQRAPLQLADGESLILDVFLDRCVIEVFANGRQAVTQLVYPELESSTQIKVFSGNQPVAVRNIQSWMLAETNAY